MKPKSIFYCILLAVLLLMLAFPNIPKRVIYLVIIFKDAFSGASPVIVYEGKPDRIWESGFEATIRTKCNRVVDRMVSVWFEPHVMPDQIPEGPMQGTSTIEVVQDNRSFERKFDLNAYGMRPLGNLKDGRWSIRGKYVGEYPAIGGLFCNDQIVHVRVDGLNFDPREHGLTLRVNRYFLH